MDKDGMASPRRKAPPFILPRGPDADIDGPASPELHLPDGSTMTISLGDFDDSRVTGLLRLHAASARAQTAPGSAHALDLAGLQSPDITLWTIWEGEALLGVGALKRLSPDHGEVKSMHTAEAARRRGAGGALLRHIIAVARERGMARLSLETGSWDYFRPALALYRRHGFAECPPFADYGPDPNSVFLSLDLEGP